MHFNTVHVYVCVRACVLSEGNQDGKFSVTFRGGVLRTVVALDRETQAAYTLVIEAIGEFYSLVYRSCPFGCESD